MNEGLRDAYLAVLGVEREPPTAAALDRLHRSHIERIPWETLWIHTGDRFGLDLEASARRIVATGRAGYCYHLNGAFSWLLQSLGYRVRRHVGGVHGPDGVAATDLTNHLVLSVTDLPSADAPEGVWYVDVGTGDALHGPLPLRAGSHVDGPFTVTLERHGNELADWHLIHHPQGAFPGMAWRSATANLDAFAARHDHLMNDPDSRFAQWALVQRRDRHGVDALRGIALLRVEQHTDVRLLETAADYRASLGDVFGIDADPARLDDVWAQQFRRHEDAQPRGS